MIVTNSEINKMETMQSFMYDDTPTPTRFIRNCEEVGLFQDLQNVNPFDETFRIAVQTSSGSGQHSLPEPMSNSATSDTLDTPLVEPSIKKGNSCNNTYVEDEDEIEMSNYDLIEIMLPEEAEICAKQPETLEEQTKPPDKQVEQNNPSDPTPETEVMEEMQEIEQTVNSADENSNDAPIIDLTDESNSYGAENFNDDVLYIDSKTPAPKKRSTAFTGRSKNKVNQRGSVPMQVLQNSNNIIKVASTTNPSMLTNSYTPVVIDGRTVYIMSGQNVNTYTGPRILNICPKPVPAKPSQESIVKQRLKNFLKVPANGENSVKPVPIALKVNTPKSREIASMNITNNNETILNRERNRIAQLRSRIKKKKWMSQLKKDNDSIFTDNRFLMAEVNSLRAEVAHLKTLLLAHRNCSVTRAMYKADLSTLINKEPVNATSSVKSTALRIPQTADESETNSTSAQQSSLVFVHLPFPTEPECATDSSSGVQKHKHSAPSVPVVPPKLHKPNFKQLKTSSLPVPTEKELNTTDSPDGSQMPKFATQTMSVVPCKLSKPYSSKQLENCSLMETEWSTEDSLASIENIKLVAQTMSVVPCQFRKPNQSIQLETSSKITPATQNGAHNMIAKKPEFNARRLLDSVINTSLTKKPPLRVVINNNNKDDGTILPSNILTPIKLMPVISNVIHLGSNGEIKENAPRTV